MKLVLASAVIVSALALAGCAATPATPPTPATSTSTPTPTATAVELSSIRMDAAGLTLLGPSEEQLGSIGFGDDPTQALAHLTDALGSDPVVETTYLLVSSGIPVTVYRWDGLLLQVAQPADSPGEHYLAVNFVAPSLGSIRLTGPGGVSVGDPMTAIPDPISVGSYEGSPNGPRYLFGDPLPAAGSDFDYYVQGFDTASQPWDAPPGATLVELVSPVTSYGGPSWKRFG